MSFCNVSSCISKAAVTIWDQGSVFTRTTGAFFSVRRHVVVVSRPLPCASCQPSDPGGPVSPDMPGHITGIDVRRVPNFR